MEDRLSVSHQQQKRAFDRVDADDDDYSQIVFETQDDDSVTAGGGDTSSASDDLSLSIGDSSSSLSSSSPSIASRVAAQRRKTGAHVTTSAEVIPLAGAPLPSLQRRRPTAVPLTIQRIDSATATERFGNFGGTTDIRFLGQGVFGRVFVLGNEGTRALKVIDCDETKQEQTLVRRQEFIAECTIQHSLGVHPHVVTLYEALWDSRAHTGYVVLDRCERTLDSYISSGFARPRTARLAQQLLQALAYCHAAGVVHRDVKPTNILMGRDRLLKLSDFGSARVLARNERCSGGIEWLYEVTTLWYRAPELLLPCCYAKVEKAQRKALALPPMRHSFASDVWSAACVIYECASGGTALFPHENDRVTLEAIVRSLGVFSSNSSNGAPTSSSSSPSPPLLLNWPSASAYLKAVQPALCQPLHVNGERFFAQLERATRSVECVRLLRTLLVLDPEQRHSAEQALHGECASYVAATAESMVVLKA